MNGIDDTIKNLSDDFMRRYDDFFNGNSVRDVMFRVVMKERDYVCRKENLTEDAVINHFIELDRFAINWLKWFDSIELQYNGN